MEDVRNFVRNQVNQSGACFVLAFLVFVARWALPVANGSGELDPGPRFIDVTAAATIEFSHLKGNLGVATILEEAGPGVCVADYNGDGWPDIYFVSGRDLHGRGIPARNALYHNNGNGTFTDVTAKAHVDGTDFGTLFHTGAVFFDYDRDGWLDLYVGGYVAFGPNSKQTCITSGAESSCPPTAYPGTPAVLYHNNRDGSFTNVTRAAGMFQPDGKNLSVAAVDYDNVGWQDLFVANDSMRA